jgi:hypothetical protein
VPGRSSPQAAGNMDISANAMTLRQKRFKNIMRIPSVQGLGSEILTATTVFGNKAG